METHWTIAHRVGFFNWTTKDVHFRLYDPEPPTPPGVQEPVLNFFSTPKPNIRIGRIPSTVFRLHLPGLSSERARDCYGTLWLGGQVIQEWSEFYVDVRMTWWWLILPNVILPTISLRMMLRRFFAHGPGHCGRCGYDLRVARERCPECGTLICTPEVRG